MWISKNDYNSLKKSADENKLSKIAITTFNKRAVEALERTAVISKELYEIKKDLKYYLDTNEEKGVVYIPKFIVEKIVYGT